MPAVISSSLQKIVASKNWKLKITSFSSSSREPWVRHMTRSDNAHAGHGPSPLLLSCALTVSRHLRGGRERKDDEQEGERNTVEYVNIMEAARRCQVSDKTIRRWIHAQKLRARFPQPNRCEIAVCDLEPFLPGQSGESLEIRVVILERQVKEL